MAAKPLGSFNDLITAAKQQSALYPNASPGAKKAKVREVLGFEHDEEPKEVRRERRWAHDGLDCEEISWSVGYGPRTHAWVLKPENAQGPLPGVLALHGHDGFQYFGKEKIANGFDGPEPSLANLRASMYEGRAFANALAKEGFVVLVHDVFLWGSRRVPVEEMPTLTQQVANRSQEVVAQAGDASGELPTEIAHYNTAAFFNEHLTEKYCTLLGTTLAGIVSSEDRVAVNYLHSRSDVTDKTGCVGLSGGGCRAALLQATCEAMSAAVVVGMMSTYEELLHHLDQHTWMFLSATWARYGDWPDLAACRAPSPLLVQYNRQDHLFTPKGMQDAHERIAAYYEQVGQAEAYRGEFYDGPHKFDLIMQASAFTWLKRQLESD